MSHSLWRLFWWRNDEIPQIYEKDHWDKVSQYSCVRANIVFTDPKVFLVSLFSKYLQSGRKVVADFSDKVDITKWLSVTQKIWLNKTSALQWGLTTQIYYFFLFTTSKIRWETCTHVLIYYFVYLFALFHIWIHRKLVKLIAEVILLYI